METNAPKRLTDVAGLAAYLNIKKSKVRSMVFQGQIIPIRMGRLLRFDLDDIDQWLESQKTTKQAEGV